MLPLAAHGCGTPIHERSGMLPVLSDITNSFGALFAGAMDSRLLSRSQMAAELNLIGQQEQAQVLAAQQEQEARREQTTAIISQLEKALEQSAELAKIDTQTIRKWERDEAPVSDMAVEAIIKALGNRKELDSDLADELRTRAKALNAALSSGTPFDKNADNFGSFLQDLMDEYRISRPDLAEAIAIQARAQELTGSLEQARDLLAGLQTPIPQKNYTLTLRNDHMSNSTQIITLLPGQIKPEHLHLMEAGALPSDDLFALAVNGLNQRRPLDPAEESALSARFDEKKRQSLLGGTYVVSSMPTLATTPLLSTTVTSPLYTAKHATKKPEPHAERHKPAAPVSDEVTRYTEAYRRVFSDFGIEPPPAENSNDHNQERTDFVNIAIASESQLTDHQIAMQRKLTKLLRPFTLEEIPQDVLDAVTSPTAKDKLEKLSAASKALYDHTFNHSRQASDAIAAMEELRVWLRNHDVVSNAQIRTVSMDNKGLEDFIAPHGLKKHQDCTKAMEYMLRNIAHNNPQVREETGGRLPTEFGNFARKANELRDYYHGMPERFNARLAELKSPTVAAAV